MSPKWLGFLLLVLFVVPGCGSHGDSAEEGDPPATQSIINAIPETDQFYVDLPEKNTGASGSGKTATFWELTRSAVSGVNNSIFESFTVVDAIKIFPPKETSDAKTVWELSAPLDSSDPGIPRFTVERLGETGQYGYSYSLRPDEEGSVWRLIWSGEMELDGSAPGIGEGSFTIDFTAAANVDSSLTRRGQVVVTFSGNESEDRNMELVYTNYLPENDDTGQVRNVTYSYRMNSDLSGHFQYSTLLNWTGSAKLEEMQILSRWHTTGYGQALVTITGEDITGKKLDKVELRECWYPDFSQAYYVQINHWSADSGYGDPTTDKESGDADLCPLSFDEAVVDGDADGDIDGDVDGDSDGDSQ